MLFKYNFFNYRRIKSPIIVRIHDALQLCDIPIQPVLTFKTPTIYYHNLLLPRMDRVRNEEVRRRAGIEREVASRADQRVLKWFGHVERMDDYRMARRVLMAEISGGRVRRRPRLGWMDGVKVALGNRGMTVEAARKTGKRREPWYICN